MRFSKAGIARRVHFGWRSIGVFILVICAVGVGSFFLTRHFVSSGEEATAGGPENDPAAAARRGLLEESDRLLAADKVAPRFGGELGERFFITNDDVPVPPELESPLALRGTCREEQVPVTRTDTELYVELPSRVGDIEITSTGPTVGQLCGDEFVWVTHIGRVATPFGPGEVNLTRARLYHSRSVQYFDAPRDRLVLTSIAGKDALVVLAVGPIFMSHVTVVERPMTPEQPGVVTYIDGDLSPDQLRRLIEQVIV